MYLDSSWDWLISPSDSVDWAFNSFFIAPWWCSRFGFVVWVTAQCTLYLPVKKNFRKPPKKNKTKLISLSSYRPQTCEYGDNCPRAHCEEELQEWIMRAAETKQIRQNIEAQGLMTYNEKLLEEYRNSSAEETIVSVKYGSIDFGHYRFQHCAAT